jgi:molybdenum cofactor synthesis domain-containing protein
MFRQLLSLEDAKRKVAKALSPKPLGIEKVSLREAVGRVLARDVASPRNVPPFHRSTVDGYAVRPTDTFDAQESKPAMLRLIGHAEVGALSTVTLKPGTTVAIVTGAPLPAHADAVVMVEDTTVNEGHILVYKPVAKGENVMAAGSDIREREVVLRRGDGLSPREVGVLAALGFAQVPVFKRPKVAVISTGAEIVAPGESLPAGKIYDINTYTLTAAVVTSGGVPLEFAVVPDDDLKLLGETLKKAVGAADMVLTSGGVSVGPKDVVPQVLDELGKPGVVVHGVAVKPGKPVAVAIVQGKPIFALPGNPTSSLLMFHLLVRPVLSKMVGTNAPPSATVMATTTAKLFAARGRRTFVMVALSRGEDRGDGWLASPVATGQSGAITTLAKADGYVELRENQQFLQAGETVTVCLFKALEVWRPI